MNFKRLLNTKIGIMCISIILGLGLATLFRRACKGKECILFNGPIINEMDGKTYKYGEFCYKYSFTPAKCDSMKKTLEM